MPRLRALLLVLLGCSSQDAPAPPNGAWPNEPAWLTVRADWGLDQTLPITGDVAIPQSPGWAVVSNAPPGTVRGWAQLNVDSSAPFSPPNVYDFVYPEGMIEGTAPATVYFPEQSAGITGLFRRLTGSRQDLGDEVYVGFWWKASAPFDLGPDGNKIAFLFNGGGSAGGQQFMILLPDGRLHVLPEYPGDFRWRDPNVNGTIVSLGVWHRIEWYCQLSTGTLKWWLDGVLQGSYKNVSNSHNFDMFQLSPTWGGNSGARKRETDHYWFDHVHVSTR
jgi:hypothetical protein